MPGCILIRMPKRLVRAQLLCALTSLFAIRHPELNYSGWVLRSHFSSGIMLLLRNQP